MIHARRWNRYGPLAVKALGVTILVGVGVLVVYSPGVAIAGIGTVLGVLALAGLLALPRNAWWPLWLGIVAISAFGPFLDIVTHRPVNWLIGLLVLVMFVVLLGKIFLPGEPRPGTVGVPSLRYWPVLGPVILVYVAYFSLQALRPDVETVNAIMAFRTPLIGLAAYSVTAYGFPPRANREGVIGRLRQLLLVFMVVGMIVAAYGLFQAVVGYDRLQAWGLTDDATSIYLQNQRNFEGGKTVFRIFSTLRRNEVLGVFLYLNIIFCAVALRLGGIQPRWLPKLSVALSLPALILTFSLTSLVTVAIWIGLLLLVVRSRRLFGMTFALCMTIIGLALVINQSTGGLIAARFAEHALDAEEGVGRLQVFNDWVSEIGNRPLLQGAFGSGICTGVDGDTQKRLEDVLGALGIRLRDPDYCDWQQLIHDNWYGSLSMEMGWLGLLLIWPLFGLAAVHTLPRLRRLWGGPERDAWTMLALSVVALWPSGFVGALLMYMPITVYFFGIVALLDVGVTCSPRKVVKDDAPLLARSS